MWQQRSSQVGVDAGRATGVGRVPAKGVRMTGSARRDNF